MGKALFCATRSTRERILTCPKTNSHCSSKNNSNSSLQARGREVSGAWDTCDSLTGGSAHGADARRA